MRMRLLLLAGSYLLFYHLIKAAYDMPNLVHGNPQFDWLPHSLAGWALRIRDLLFYFLFALIPYLVLWRWYPQKKLVPAIGVIITGLSLAFLLSWWSKGGGGNGGPRLKSYFLTTFFYMLISMVYGTVLYFIRYSHYHELRQKELQLQGRQSELSFLRSQINPHFLFNSLNNIYALVYQGSGEALAAIAGLSDLLRYMLYDAPENVPLQKEIDYIRKYIELQKLRFDHTILAELRVEGDAPETPIAPLLLIPFVENAFKHGDFSGGAEGLTIAVHATRKKTYFHCNNKKGVRQKDQGGGIGLENVRRRLSLLYPGRHTLLIEEDDARFSVNLELIHA